MATMAGKPITGYGLGLMRLTWHFGPVSDEVAFSVLKAAIAAGATVWNGADFYGSPEANSLHLMNRYFTKYPDDADKVVLCIKGGIVNMAKGEMDCSAAGMRQRIEGWLAILDGKKSLDIAGPTRVDPNVPIEETIAELAKMKQEGKIGGIQLTEVRAETIRRAAAIHHIDTVEAEASLWSTEIFTNGVAETCAELGITISAHTPLGQGMLTGNIRTPADLTNDMHRSFPRWQPENMQANLDLVDAITQVAKRKNCTPAQLALSWLRRDNGKKGSPWIVPVVGARSEARVKENCVDVELGEGDVAEIGEVLKRFPVQGTRWPAGASKLNEY